MVVTTNTIMQKMIKEAQQAKNNQNNHVEMMKHVANVKLLCELLLEDEAPQAIAQHETTADEMKAMMGTLQKSQTTDRIQKQSRFDEDDANGDSIFDF